jgi:hypothetical protein
VEKRDGRFTSHDGHVVWSVSAAYAAGEGLVKFTYERPQALGGERAQG